MTHTGKINEMKFLKIYCWKPSVYFWITLWGQAIWTVMQFQVARRICFTKIIQNRKIQKNNDFFLKHRFERLIAFRCFDPTSSSARSCKNTSESSAAAAILRAVLIHGRYVTAITLLSSSLFQHHRYRSVEVSFDEMITELRSFCTLRPVTVNNYGT